MAYADTLRAVSATLNIAADKIDGLLVKNTTVVYTTPVLSTTSTSAVDLTSATATLTLTATQKAFLLFDVSFSHGTALGGVSFSLLQNGTSVKSWLFLGFNAFTGGYGQGASLHSLLATGAGTHTYKVRWFVNSGTGYVSSYTFTVLVFETV